MPTTKPHAKRRTANSATDSAELTRRRVQIDRVNRALCAVLQQRARLVAEIAGWKRDQGLALVDPRRERAMLQAMLDAAPAGFDRAALRRILVAVLRESRAVATRQAAKPRAVAMRQAAKPRAVAMRQAANSHATAMPRATRSRATPTRPATKLPRRRQGS